MLLWLSWIFTYRSAGSVQQLRDCISLAKVDNSAQNVMPTALTTPSITTLTEFTTLVEKHLTSSKGQLWHRGCGDFDNHHLSPSLFRHPTKKNNTSDLLALENEMLVHFRQRSVPFIARPLRDDDWERLFFMQHFGIPTRLLDWSENPFVALYFALTSKSETNGDAAVWLLDPVAWNRKSLNHMTFKEGILSVEDDRLDGFKPGAAESGMNTDPVAIYGFHNSARIVAQRGVFVIAGKDTDPMEKIYLDRGYPQDALIKVRIPKAERVKLLKSLFQVGLTHSVIYPDLDGLAKEMKNFFGF